MELLDTAQRTLNNMRECYQVQGQQPAPQLCTIMLSCSCQLWRQRKRPLSLEAESDDPCCSLQVIDQLCSECASLIENHEKIQLLSAVHYNLGKTLQVGFPLFAAIIVLLLLAIIVWLCIQLGLRWVSSSLCSPLFAGLLVQDVENIVALPNEAAEAEEMLKDETQLLQVMLAGSVSCTEAM